jgi:hypothetical protein
MCRPSSTHEARFNDAMISRVPARWKCENPSGFDERPRRSGVPSLLHPTTRKPRPGGPGSETRIVFSPYRGLPSPATGYTVASRLRSSRLGRGRIPASGRDGASIGDEIEIALHPSPEGTLQFCSRGRKSPEVKLRWRVPEGRHIPLSQRSPTPARTRRAEQRTRRQHGIRFL